MSNQHKEIIDQILNGLRVIDREEHMNKSIDKRIENMEIRADCHGKALANRDANSRGYGEGRNSGD